jgi:hypothetical protein
MKWERRMKLLMYLLYMYDYGTLKLTDVILRMNHEAASLENSLADL